MQMLKERKNERTNDEECSVPVNLWTLVCDRWISLCERKKKIFWLDHRLKNDFFSLPINGSPKWETNKRKTSFRLVTMWQINDRCHFNRKKKRNEEEFGTRTRFLPFFLLFFMKQSTREKYWSFYETTV